MEFAFSEEQEAFRGEVAEFIKGKFPEELKFGHLRKTDRYKHQYTPFFQELARKHWLCLHWPEEYGGLGRPLMETAILTEELGIAGAPRPNIGTSFVGTSILTFGSEEQKKEFLPRIAGDELFLCEGFTEPNAGSDLASLQTKAYAVDEGYIIEGSKLLTSYAHIADYCMLLARTDPELPKHKGLSAFLVDMKMPGITCGPFKDLFGGHYFNEVFFDKVKVSKDCLVGEENTGWQQAVYSLNMERIFFGGGTYCTGTCKGIIKEVVPFLDGIKETCPHQYVYLRHRLAELVVDIEIARLLAYRSVWKLEKTVDIALEVSISKIFGGELTQRVVNTAMQVLGLYGQLLPESKRAPLHGIISLSSIGSIGETIGGGTSEIQRLVVSRQLGLPR